MRKLTFGSKKSVVSFRRFIALLCLIAGSFGSGTVAALDCTITMGRSCQGVDSVFKIDAQFPLDNRNHLVIANRGAAECTLSGGGPWQGAMYIPGRGETTFYNPGYYNLSSGRQCDLSIRGEQDPPRPPHGSPVRVRIVTAGCDASLTPYCDGRKAPVKVTDSYPNPMWTDANGMLNLDHGLQDSGANFYLDFEGLNARGNVTCSAHVGFDVSQGATVTLQCSKYWSSIDFSKTSFDFLCPPAGSYSDGQTIGDWRIWIKSGGATTVPQWIYVTSRPGHEPRSGPGYERQSTEISCGYGRQIFATREIPGTFSCVAPFPPREGHSLQGICHRR